MEIDCCNQTQMSTPSSPSFKASQPIQPSFYTKISKLVDFKGHEIFVLGYVSAIRSGKKLTFLEVRYGEHQVQVVAESSTLPKLTVSSYIEVKGIVTLLPEDKRSTLPVEIGKAEIRVLSLADESTPSKCPPDASVEVQLLQRHYYFRDVDFARKLRLTDRLLQAFRSHFQEIGAMEILVPLLTGVQCEGGATLFKLEHPGKSSLTPMTAFLTQSSQFALEMTLPGVGDTYCIASSFRAEHSHTRRHLTEFTHVECEWGGILRFEYHLDKLRHLMQSVVSKFLVLAEKELKECGKFERVSELYEMTKDILVLEHKDAIVELHRLGITRDDGTPFEERDDIPEKQERELIDKIGKIVFLTKFPREFKSFYMALDPKDPTRVLGCDVEVPGVGEIIGSGVRESDVKMLEERLLEQKLKPEDYSEYLDLRASGFGMTSGMGLGLGRMLCWLLDMKSIRLVTAFPRFPGYLRP